MDITSTSASTVQVNKPIEAQKTASTPVQAPEDFNLQAIQTEIKQITDEMKKTLDSKLSPLEKDTVQFSKPTVAEEISPATPTAPTAEITAPPQEPIKENTPAA